MRFEDLYDVYLLGHSYSGFVTGAVAHRIPERNAHLIFLDALLPEDGKSPEQIYESHGQHDFVQRVQRIVEQEGEGWYWPPPSPDAPNLRVADPDDQAWMEEKLTPHPMGTSNSVIRLGNPAADKIPRTYISCLPHPTGGLIPIFTAQVQNDPSWNYLELQASHDPMITDPDALTEVLIDIAS
ncbi:MAG: alpha/beta hydrolase [Thermomicrobiales bacterium]